jgi:hypothetical protein
MLNVNQCMDDLTIIYLTLNRLPKEFSAYQYGLIADMGFPLINVSREPMHGNTLLDTEKPGYVNIYRQMLRAAKVAATPYVAIAEDDVLYPKEHFTFYRPALDTFAYNQNRLALFTWGEAIYSWRNRKSNCTLIAPREQLIEALSERFDKYPTGDFPPEFVGEVGRERVEKGLGVKIQKSEEVFSTTSVIQLNHEHAHEERQKNKRKSHGNIRMYDIPHWGHAKDLIRKYG